MDMTHKSRISHALLLAVAASLALAPTARAQQPRPQRPAFDAQRVVDQNEAAFAGSIVGLRFAGKWDQIRDMGRVRREAHPDESVGWNAEALGNYGNGDVEAAIKVWEAAPNLQEIPDGPQLLATARAVQRNFPDQKLQPFQFVSSDATDEQGRFEGRANILRKAKDYDAIEAMASELQKSGQADATGYPALQSFFDGLSKIYQANEAPDIEQAIRIWRAARPNSIVARLAEIEFFTNLAGLARGTGYADSITPAMSQSMNEALAHGAQGIAELPAASVESPLTFVVLQHWGHLSGDGRAFLDPVYREGNARFPTYQPILRARINDLLPRWYGVDGELMQLLQEHADALGGTEGDIDYALGFARVRLYEGDLPHDNARFWRGLEAQRQRFPDSISLRTLQVQFGLDQADHDGNYEYVRRALIEKDGYLLDQFAFDGDHKRAQMSESRMETLARDKPR